MIMMVLVVCVEVKINTVGSNQLGFGSMVANLADFNFMWSPNIKGNITKLNYSTSELLASEVLTFCDIFTLCTKLSLVLFVTKQPNLYTE